MGNAKKFFDAVVKNNTYPLLMTFLKLRGKRKSIKIGVLTYVEPQPHYAECSLASYFGNTTFHEVILPLVDLSYTTSCVSIDADTFFEFNPTLLEEFKLEYEREL